MRLMRCVDSVMGFEVVPNMCLKTSCVFFPLPHSFPCQLAISLQLGKRSNALVPIGLSMPTERATSTATPRPHNEGRR